MRRVLRVLGELLSAVSGGAGKGQGTPSKGSLLAPSSPCLHAGRRDAGNKGQNQNRNIFTFSSGIDARHVGTPPVSDIEANINKAFFSATSQALLRS